MPIAPSIRLVEAADVASAVDLLHAQLAEHEIATRRDALRAVVQDVVADSRHGFMLLAEMDDRAVGVAYAAAHLSAEHGGTIGWLEELYVAPEFRDRGVGSALLTEVMRRARALAWCGLELEVVAGHDRTIPLYERHGFQRLSRTRLGHSF